jgi:hypothetical protein
MISALSLLSCACAGMTPERKIKNHFQTILKTKNRCSRPHRLLSSKFRSSYFFIFFIILSIVHLPFIIIIPLPHFSIFDILSIFFIAASAPPVNAERTSRVASVVLIIILSFLRLLIFDTQELARFKACVWSTLP